MEGVIMNSYATFRLTNNSKVRFYNEHYNTFSLAAGLPEHGGTCVHATVGEGGCVGKCYDINLRKLYKKYAANEDFNTSLVWDKPYEEQVRVIQNSVTKWLLNNGAEKPFFRIHTGGEFFSLEYTLAWREVMTNYPKINFWAYTRAMFTVPLLVDLQNLTLMLSCDPVNKNDVLKVYEKFKHHDNLAVAWMGNTLPEDMPQDRKLLVCPEVTGKMGKMKDIGACARCRACIDRRLKSGQTRHIQFPIHR